MTDWLLVMLVLLIATWVWMVIKVLEFILYISSWFVIDPWAAVILVGVGALILIVEKATRKEDR